MASEQKEEIIIDKRHGRRYAKGRFLGKGGFARCYELTDLETKLVYAGKIVAKSSLVKQHHKDKMAMEIRIHRAVHHQHIVSFHGYFEDDQNIYIVLELCRRRSLMELHKRRRVLTEPETRYFMKQIVSALTYLHGEKVIHRDVKLGNLFLNDDLEIKLGDFGLATKLDFDGEKKKTLCGTPNYTAPEVIAKKGHSYEVDMWSLGCIMYTLLVGSPPFETKTLKETFTRIRRNEYELPQQVSNTAQLLIIKLLQPDPSRRPKSHELVEDEFFKIGFCPSRLPVSCLTMPPRFGQESRTSALTTATSRRALTEPNQVVSTGTAGEEKRGGEVAKPAEKEVVASAGPFSAAEPNPESYLQSLLVQLQELLASNPSSKPKSMHDDAEDPAVCPVFWIGKWVDYSDKYGFGYTLCDGSVGVLFNDTARVIMAGNGSNVQYISQEGEEMFMTIDEYPQTLGKKMTLLKYFRSYMSQHLLRAGGAKAPERYDNARLPTLRTWFRTRSAIIMHLSNGILQINFFSDHTKVILCPRMQAVTFIDEQRSFRTFPLSMITIFGCSETLHNRLTYAKTTIERMLTDGIPKGEQVAKA